MSLSSMVLVLCCPCEGGSKVSKKSTVVKETQQSWPEETKGSVQRKCIRNCIKERVKNSIFCK